VGARFRSDSASFHLGGSGIRCSGPDAAPQITTDLDLSALHWDLSFEALVPEIKLTCDRQPTTEARTRPQRRRLLSSDPPPPRRDSDPGTPIEVRVSPVLEITASGTLSTSFTWSPRFAFGFGRVARGGFTPGLPRIPA